MAKGKSNSSSGKGSQQKSKGGRKEKLQYEDDKGNTSISF